MISYRCMIHQLCFFFNDTATTEIYTLSLHDAPSDLGWTHHVGHRRAPRRLGDTTLRRGASSDAGSHAPALAKLPPRSVNRSARGRQSTRLNSSHANISYGAFCLKKKETCSTGSPIIN